MERAPFNKFHNDSEQDDDENEVQTDATNSKNNMNPLDFCQNPETVRALAEQRRRAKEDGNHRKPYRYSNPTGN